MPSIYRISRDGRELVVYVTSAEAIEGAIRDFKPGSYYIDEISGDASRLAEMAAFDHGWGRASRRESAARRTRSKRK